MDFDRRVEELSLELPTAPKPVAAYVPLVRVDRVAYVSGHGPLLPDGTLTSGKVGGDLSGKEGYQAARQTGLAMLATLKDQLGSLNKINRLIKVLGMVNATPEFTDHPQVINGFSDLMVEVFGEAGLAARSAVGMGSLPGNIAIEVEAIFELTST